MDIAQLMQLVVDKQGSDLHLMADLPPYIRLHGDLMPVEGEAAMTGEQVGDLIYGLLSPSQREYIQTNLELDFGYQFGDVGRFRVNVYHNRGKIAAAMRLIPSRIKTLEELQLPPILYDLANYKQGLILVTGPTGEGKSTTLASMIEYINTERSEHILTIEDPIEFVYSPKKSIISQREVNQDTLGWDVALRSSMREDPDVVLVGEMRDFETMAAAVTLAETGHLVFATLHTATAAQTVDRIIDVFPAHQQSQIRQQLAGALQATVSQRLVPRVGGGRIAALEIMIGSSAVRNLIREGKTFQIDNVIQTSGESGMTLIESYLLGMVQRGDITMETAQQFAFRAEEFKRMSAGF